MTGFQVEFTKLLKTEETSKNELLYVFRELGYEIKL
jgi:type I restriction enzyme M protein